MKVSARQPVEQVAHRLGNIVRRSSCMIETVAVVDAYIPRAEPPSFFHEAAHEDPMRTEQVVDGIRIKRIETVLGGHGVLRFRYVFRITQDLLSVDDALDLVLGKLVSLDSQ